MRVELFDSDACLDIRAIPTRAHIGHSYTVDEDGVDARITRHAGDEGGYPTFGEAKEAAIEWLETLKGMCDDRIGDFRSAETYEDCIRSGVAGRNPDDETGGRMPGLSPARDRVQVHSIIGEGWLHTHGMECPCYPELEVRHVPAFLAEDAALLLRHACDYMLETGNRIEEGETMVTSRHTTLRFVRPVPMPGNEDHYKAERLQIVAIDPTCDCCGGRRSAARS